MLSEQEAGLLAAVAAYPKDRTPRLVYADYLDDVNRPTEAAAWRRLPHTASPFESLIGRTVTSAAWDGDSTLLLYTDRGPVSYSAEGDCCSSSWFYRFRGVAALIGHRVLAVHDGDLDGVNTDDGLCRDLYDEAYGYSILTTGGVCDVVFRNSSNGYYGGWLDPRDTVYQNCTIPLTEDWQHPLASVRVGTTENGK